MNLHEYQAKELLGRAGIPITPYAVASSLPEVEEAITALRLEEAVLKVQIHAGGRGKAGGVQVASSRAEILQKAKALLGMRIVNQQTGPKGLVSEKILLSEKIEVVKEYYVAAALDRERATPILIASSEGGVEIEEIAHKYPERLFKEDIALDGSLHDFQLWNLSNRLGWRGNLGAEGRALLARLARLFIESDASMLEINPLVLTSQEHLVALDAKCSIDENALFRHPEFGTWYDPSQYSENEGVARDLDLSYIELEGEIGCMVNGAGLAMATMDIIHFYGGRPANFLDIGGGVTQEKVAQGFSILLRDPQIKALFINIFGGIVNCALLAKGLLDALKQQPLKVPLIVRMEGTHVEQGREILKNSGLPIQMTETMDEGARKAVEASKK